MKTFSQWVREATGDIDDPNKTAHWERPPSDPNQTGDWVPAQPGQAPHMQQPYFNPNATIRGQRNVPTPYVGGDPEFGTYPIEPVAVEKKKELDRIHKELTQIFIDVHQKLKMRHPGYQSGFEDNMRNGIDSVARAGILLGAYTQPSQEH